MIAIPKPSSNASTIGHRNAPRDVAWHEQFLDLLPAIRRHALVSFQHLQREARAEAVQDVVAYALVAFVRLLQFGRGEIAYAAPLAGFGVARVRDGRRVGTSVNVLDVTSRHANSASTFVSRASTFGTRAPADGRKFWLKIDRPRRLTPRQRTLIFATGLARCPRTIARLH